MMKKPCASCKPSDSPTSKKTTKKSSSSSTKTWIKTNEGTANWLKEKNVVMNFFKCSTAYGFWVDVIIPKQAQYVWCSAYLDEKYAPRAKNARNAYTGTANGDKILNILKPNTATNLTLKAPTPYTDDPAKGGTLGITYPPHYHYINSKKEVFTLPFLIPFCNYDTALSVCKNKAWKIVYVLDNIAEYKTKPLPRTQVITTAKEIAQRFSKKTPLLLYCAKQSCDASKNVAFELVKKYGFELVCKYSGGMKEIKKINSRN